MRPPAAELRHLYIDERWDVDHIVAHYGCSRSTVYRWLHDLDIRRPRRSWALTISAERLRELYDTLTLEQIADREHVTLNQVYKAMKHHRIPRRRPRPQAPPKPHAKEPPPTDELRRVLQEEGSVKGVAAQYGVGVSTAHRWLSIAHISPLRPPGQRRNRRSGADGVGDRDHSGRTTSTSGLVG